MNKKAAFARTPLSRQVADFLRAEILSHYSPGDQLEAESKLCEKLEVSLTTMREALSVLAQEGLIERSQGKGTFVCDPPDGRHVAILIDLDISHPQTSYFFLRTVQVLRTFCARAGFEARLYVGHATPFGEESGALTCEEFLRDLEARRFSAVATIATQPYGQYMVPLQQQNVPVIGGGGSFPLHVELDTEGLIRAGVDILAKRGRKNLAVIGTGGATCHRVFTAQMAAHELPVREEWLLTSIPHGPEQPDWDVYQPLWSGNDRPDGLLVTDDMLLMPTIMAALQAGVQIPGELLVATHVNRGAPLCCPVPLIKLEIDPDQYALRIGAMLTDVLAQRPVAENPAVLGFTTRDETRSAVAV